MTGRYLSLFTGAGGMDLGLHNAGWTPTAFAEIDRDASDVLNRQWPEVPNLGDVQNVAHQDEHAGLGPVGTHGARRDTDRPGRDPRGAWADVDLIAGGFPCQDISVAGRRAGLAGERSGLWWEFHRIVGAIRPRTVLVENVEGLLSSNGGRDMGAILDALVELGYGVAWRVFDSQHLGVPQRRRRVFLLAILGGHPGAQRASEVLALAQGGGGGAPEGRGPWQDVARTLTAGAHGRRVSAPGRRQEDDYNLVVGTLTVPQGGWRVGADEAAAGHLVVGATGQVAHTLTAEGADASEDGTGRGTPIVAGALTAQGPGALDDNAVGGGHITASQTGVRRLTPRECERLQGWPDDWTRYRPDGSEISDSARYRLIGNGVTAPVTEWIGQRLAEHLTATAEAAA